MTLDLPDALLRVLLDRGLVDRGAAVDGDVLVVSDPVRGWFRILEKSRTQLFVRSGQRAQAVIAREVAVFANEPLRAFLPDLRIREDDLLVFAPFPGGLDVVEFHRTSRLVADWIPPLIGIALAAVHATSAVDAPVPRELPNILRGADSALTGPLVAQAIARVAAQWTGEVLLHGDASFQRIVVAPAPERRIQFVAWDDCRLGDPAWDLGCVLESYYAWSLDPKVVSDVEGPVCPLAPHALMSAVVSFWSSYSAAARLAPVEARTRLVRAFAYAGARLIERVHRMLQKAEPVTPEMTQMLQGAIALMTSPAAAADAFFITPRVTSPQAWGSRGTW